MQLATFDPKSHDDQTRLLETQNIVETNAEYREFLLTVARLLPEHYEDRGWPVPPPDCCLQQASEAVALALLLFGHPTLQLLAHTDGLTTVQMTLTYLTEPARNALETQRAENASFGHSIIASFLTSYILQQNVADSVEFGKQLLSKTHLPTFVAQQILEVVHDLIRKRAVNLMAEAQNATKH